MLWDRPIYTFRATSPAGQTPEQRATAAVQCLNDALAAGMAEFDISVARDATGPRVTLLGRPLLSVLPGDLDDPKYSPDDAAQAVVHALRVALFSDTLNRQIKPR
jgi:hypothetical protein